VRACRAKRKNAGRSAAHENRGLRIRPAFLRAFDALGIEARYAALRNYIFWTITFSAELWTAPIFTCAGFIPMLNCQMRRPAVSVRLRLT